MKWWVPISALAFGAFGALSLRQKYLLLQSLLEVLIFNGCELQFWFTVEIGTVQWQGHGVLVDRIAVFAVIQQRHTKVVLRQVGPFVTPNLTRTPWWKINSITSATSPTNHRTESPDRSFNLLRVLCCTSNLAQSHEVFLCVGLCTWPNWISYVALALRTLTGNSTLRNLWDSAHFT